MPSKFGKILPWEEGKLKTCYLEDCDQVVDKYGDFCCKEHQNKYWDKILKKNKRYTLKEVRDKIESWRKELKKTNGTLYEQVEAVFN